MKDVISVTIMTKKSTKLSDAVLKYKSLYVHNKH